MRSFVLPESFPAERRQACCLFDHVSSVHGNDGAVDIISLLVLGKMVPSRSEGRRAIEQGGVTVDGEKISDVRATVTESQLKDGVLIKRKAFFSAARASFSLMPIVAATVGIS